MTDFLVKYTSEAALDAVASHITGLWIPDTIDEHGNDIPGHVGTGESVTHIGEWALSAPFPYSGGLGRLFRWNADINSLTTYLTLGSGVMTTVNNVTTITAGPVTLISPLPNDCPMSF